MIKKIVLMVMLVFLFSCTGPGSSSNLISEYSKFVKFISKYDIKNTDDLSLPELNELSIKIKTAAEVYNISENDLEKYLINNASNSLKDFVLGNAGLNSGIYYNKTENIALSLVPEELPSEIIVEDDGSINLTDNGSVELKTNDMLNNISSSGKISLDLKNSTEANITCIVFRKGSTYERNPYIDNNPGDGILLKWIEDRTDETMTLQLYKSKINFIFQVVDNNGYIHKINIKNSNRDSISSKVIKIINSGNYVHLEVIWENYKFRIFLQDVDDDGNPLFDGDGNPKMINVVSSVGFVDVNDSSIIENLNISYEDYINNIGGIYSINTNDPNDPYVEVMNSEIKNTESNINIGSFTLERIRLFDINDSTTEQPSSTFNANGLFVKNIEMFVY